MNLLNRTHDYLHIYLRLIKVLIQFFLSVINDAMLLIKSIVSLEISVYALFFNFTLFEVGEPGQFYYLESLDDSNVF